MVASKIHFASLTALIIACMGGCLGCYNKPKLISSVDEPLKGKKPRAWTAPKRRISEAFWTTSSWDMDNNGAQSPRSITSTCTSAQMHDSHGTCSSNHPSEFVNHGLLLWNQTRQQWIGSEKPEKKRQQLREPCINWNATYDSLLCSNKPFRKPIPLPEMIDFLVDIWEQEGLYD